MATRTGTWKATDLGLGCGLPTRHGGLRDGGTLLHLGSGAGIDALVTRRIVGESGQVIGVDMTPEMIARSHENVAKLAYTNVEFRLGELGHLPVETQTIDIVVSNCVPDKRKAFVEIFRVLKPGAHFCISDIVATASLPDAIREAARSMRAAWRERCHATTTSG